MNPKIWIALLALAFGAPPAGEPQAQPIAPGLAAPAPQAVTNPARTEIKPGQGLAGEPAAVSPETKRQTLEAYDRLPLAFVANAGQTNANIRLYAQGPGFRFAFLRDQALFAFTKTEEGKTSGAAIALRFLGARPEAEPTGGRPGTGRVNYLLGNDPTRWRTNLPTYEDVAYPNLWPGIDLVFRGADGQLKYEFVLRPGAEVADIRLAYRGAEGLSLDRDGNLLVETPLGTLTDARPRAYQEQGGERVPVASRYRLWKEERYGFAIGAYDRGHPLVIDPGLLYSTYLGGTGADHSLGIAIDTAGNAYVTGWTQSTDFPTTTGAFDTMPNGGATDAFVTKLSTTGSALAYSTYLGGSSFDEGLGIAVDGAGNAYVAGRTGSADFPTTLAGFDTMLSGVVDAFVTKLNATGSALLYSTYVGGSGGESGEAIAVDSAGSAYVTGQNSSADFPTTPGAFDTTFNGSSDAFVTKLNATGSAPLVYSTYLGGSSTDVGFGIALGAAGNAYVAGLTGSANFPTTLGAFDTTFNGFNDVFVTQLNATGSAPLLYSTYLGGSSFDEGYGLAVDAAGNAYVTGLTLSTDFPTTLGAFDTTFNGTDAFVTKLNATGSGPLLYSTYLGGSAFDEGFGIAVDAAGNAHVTGQTHSVDFPTTTGAFDMTYNINGDAFVTKLNATGSAPLVYSTYLGGSAFEGGFGIAVDAAGNAYLTGRTASTNFPTTPGVFDMTHNGGSDAFVTKLDMVGAPATLVLTPATATNPVGTSHTVTATVTDAAGQSAPGVVVRFTVTGAHTVTGSCTTGLNGQCTFSYPGTQAGSDAIDAYADSDNDDVQDPSEPTGAATKVWTPPTPGCPPDGGDDDEDDDGLEDNDESLFRTLLGNPDSDGDGREDGNDDSDDDGEDDEDEDDGTEDECPNDSDGDGEDDEDEDDDEDDND